MQRIEALSVQCLHCNNFLLGGSKLLPEPSYLSSKTQRLKIPTTVNLNYQIDTNNYASCGNKNCKFKFLITQEGKCCLFNASYFKINRIQILRLNNSHTINIIHRFIPLLTKFQPYKYQKFIKAPNKFCTYKIHCKFCDQFICYDFIFCHDRMIVTTSMTRNLNILRNLGNAKTEAGNVYINFVCTNKKCKQKIGKILLSIKDTPRIIKEREHICLEIDKVRCYQVTYVSRCKFERDFNRQNVALFDNWELYDVMSLVKMIGKNWNCFVFRKIKPTTKSVYVLDFLENFLKDIVII